MSRESLSQKTENREYHYAFEQSNRTYSKEFQTLFWMLHNGGIHAKNAIKTIGGIAKLDVETAHKVYKTLALAGLSLPVIITIMTTAPASTLLGVLGGSIVGLVGRIGEAEANKVLDERKRTKTAIELAAKYKGRIALLEGREASLHAKIKARFESAVFILEQRYQGQLVQKEDQITRLREQNIKLIHEKKREIKTIISEANEKISTGIMLREQAKANEKEAIDRLQYADTLCRNQATELTVLKDQLQDYDFLCQELETQQKENKPIPPAPQGENKMIDYLNKKNKKLKAEKKKLKKQLKQSHETILKTKNEVIASKDETIKAQQQEIEALKFSMKYALLSDKPDTGTKRGEEDSKRYTAICEGVEAGYINDLSYTGIKNFKYAGKGASQRVAKKYRDALIADGLAQLQNGELKPIH